MLLARFTSLKDGVGALRTFSWDVHQCRALGCEAGRGGSSSALALLGLQRWHEAGREDPPAAGKCSKGNRSYLSQVGPLERNPRRRHQTQGKGVEVRTCRQLNGRCEDLEATKSSAPCGTAATPVPAGAKKRWRENGAR